VLFGRPAFMQEGSVNGYGPPEAPRDCFASPRVTSGALRWGAVLVGDGSQRQTDRHAWPTFRQEG